jgi:hypothetical protein
VAMLVPLVAALAISVLAGNLRPSPRGSEASPALVDQARGRKG